MPQILVVEDDRTIGQALDSTLRSHGYATVWQCTGADAMAVAGDEEFDLILLDLGLPDFDGVQLCGQLRKAQPQCVLVILTARQDEADVIVGLEAGADDYLVKPVGLGELLARLRVHLRRGMAAPSGEQSVLVVGGLQVDTSARKAHLHGTEISLRTREFDLLAQLSAQQGAAVSRDTLMAQVWDEHWHGSSKTLDVHIAALRQKLVDAASGSGAIPRIVTLRGHGYRLEQV